MENNMELLQELLQRTETIQKINALQEQASREILSWPALSGKDRLKRGIRKYLLRQAVPPADRYSWPNGLLAGGLSQVQKVLRDNGSAEILKKYFDRWIRKGMPLYYVDNTVNGMALLDLYETTGEEKYLDAASRIAAFLKEHKKDAGENLLYRRKDADMIYADTVGMVSPFLCRYGVLKKDPSLVRLGVLQIIHFLDHGMDDRTGLPYHCFDSAAGIRYGCVGWGRAVGWLMGGIAESLMYLPEQTPQFSFMQGHLQRLACAAITYQRQDGSFSWLLPAAEGPADTSATAMIACALLTGIRRGCLEEDRAEQVKAAAEFLLSCMKNGKVEQCSAECTAYSEYPQRYGSYPWGDGPALKLFAALEEVE